MKRVLIVVDMQNDFITGPLGTKDAKRIVLKVKKKIEKYLKCGDDVVFTQDTHSKNYLETNEGKNLPVEHCFYNTEGWKVHPKLDDPRFPHCIKKTFGYEEWKEAFPEEIREIEICGVCTDICIISNALILKTYYPEAKIVVDSKCCAGSTPKKHKVALEAMKNCQIAVI